MKRVVAFLAVLFVVGCGEKEGGQSSTPDNRDALKESLRKEMLSQLSEASEELIERVEDMGEDRMPPTEQEATKGKKGFPSSLKEIMFGSNPPVTERDKAFWEAAKTGNLDEVQSLLKEGVDIDIYGSTVGVDFGCTALFWASKHNHKEVVQYLLENNAYIDAGAGMGGSALQIAVYEGHSEIVELLVSEGANVHAKNSGGGTVFDFASEEMAELIRKSMDEDK
jgi:ankyrin repeat protein